MTIRLIRPSKEYEQSYGEYILELGDEERYPFTLDLEYEDFGVLLRRLDDFEAGTNIPSGFVPSSSYWLVDGRDLIGVASLRHHLNEAIKHCGGHIGLGVRPSRRGLGHGATLMKLTLREARRKGLGALHIHCHKDNQASAKLIASNGGILDSEIEYGKPGEIVQRYLLPAD